MLPDNRLGTSLVSFFDKCQSTIRSVWNFPRAGAGISERGRARGKVQHPTASNALSERRSKASRVEEGHHRKQRVVAVEYSHSHVPTSSFRGARTHPYIQTQTHCTVHTSIEHVCSYCMCLYVCVKQSIPCC